MIIAIQIIVEEFAQRLIAAIRDNIKNKQVTPFGSMHTTGHAEDSLFYRIDGNRLIVGSTWAYITVLEDGRKPGKFAPPQVIERWINDKPIVSPIPTKSLVFLINRKLKEEGSLIYRQGGKSGILSDFINLDYIQKNLTPKLARSMANVASDLLFKPGTTIQLQ